SEISLPSFLCGVAKSTIFLFNKSMSTPSRVTIYVYGPTEFQSRAQSFSFSNRSYAITKSNFHDELGGTSLNMPVTWYGASWSRTTCLPMTSVVVLNNLMHRLSDRTMEDTS